VKKVINIDEVSDLTLDQLRRALCQVGYALTVDAMPTGVVMPHEQPGPAVLIGSMKIEFLDLPSPRAYNLLKREGLDTVGKLLEYGIDNLMDLRNMSESCMDQYQVALAKIGYHDFEFTWPHEHGRNPAPEPPREPVIPATPKRVGALRSTNCAKCEQTFDAAPFGRLPKYCPNCKKKATGKVRDHVPGTCGRCSSPDHQVGECPEPMPGGRKPASEPSPQDPRDEGLYIAPAPSPPSVPTPGIIDSMVADARSRNGQTDTIHVPGEEVDDNTLTASGLELQERWSRGLGIGYDIHPDVMALYGVDLDLVSSALDNPQSAELRPESYKKDKRYGVLQFSRGDIRVILGCKTPARPKVIAVYVTAMLEHDTHRTEGAGGGGKRKQSGPPKTGAQVASRLRDLGAEVDMSVKEKVTTVFFDGKEMGKITVDPDREQAESDWNRIQRKINAIKKS